MFAILRNHRSMYPAMQPQDLLKLIYQSAYGCGHLLPSMEQAAGMIRSEMERTPAKEIPPYVPIGNGLCRLELAAPEVQALDAEQIWQMMLCTDRCVRARKDTDLRFSRLISTAEELIRRGEMPFAMDEWKAYLKHWNENGRGVVSHTQTYRDACQPAYRVVLEDYALLAPVAAEIARGRKLVVIDGPCGSGKTTLAGRLGEMYGAAPIPMDDFFLPPAMRTPERLQEPGGNVHRERFMQEVLRSLPDEARWQRYDCATGQMLDRFAPDTGLWIIEGSYSHHPAFAQRYRELDALRVYVEVDPQEQLRRIQKRDPQMLEAFQSRWIPLEKNYFQAYDIRGGADVVIHSRPSE